MPITQLNQLQIAYKKLLGKSHVSPLKDSSEEAVPSFVQSPSSIIFGQTLPSGSQIPTNSPANLYQTSSGGIVELVRFELTALGDGNYTPTTSTLAGTTIDEQGDAATLGNHAYALRISGSYNARSNNPRKNTGLFTDGGSLTGSAGSLQLVPPAFGALYASKVYKSDGSTQIPPQDNIDWNLDYSTGVLFTQDFIAETIPAFVDAFLYIGKYTNELVADLSASLQSVAGTNAYTTMSVGGVAVIADTATGNLTIASGSFGGAATTNNNLLISASAGNDTITFSLRDNLSFTSMTASNGYLLSNDNNNRQYSTNGGTTASLNTLTFRDTDTTSATTQSIGRIAFESLDTNTSGSNNSQVVRAFIEAVSEDDTPDAFLAFGTAVSGALAQERMRVTNTGVSITGNITASGNISSSGNLILTGNITASGIPTPAGPDSRRILMIDTASGAIVQVTANQLGNVVGVNSFTTISIGGTGGSGGPVVADSSTDTLNINSSDANLTIVGDGTTDTITFDFADSPIFTHITASGNISASGNIIVSGDIAVNGGDITTNQTNFNLLEGATGTLTIGAAATNVTIPGNLIVNGDTTIINTSTLSVEDKFIVLGRGVGSTAPASEGGIIIEGAGGSGSAFVFNSGSGANVSNRWGIATNVPTGSTNVTPTDFMVSVSQSSAAPSDANPPSYGGSAGGFGNMYIQDNGEIWIYS